MFLYVCDILQKNFYKITFFIPIKTFLIKALPKKAFWLEGLLQKAVLNWPLIGIACYPYVFPFPLPCYPYVDVHVLSIFFC